MAKDIALQRCQLSTPYSPLPTPHSPISPLSTPLLLRRVFLLVRKRKAFLAIDTPDDAGRVFDESFVFVADVAVAFEDDRFEVAVGQEIVAFLAELNVAVDVEMRFVFEDHGDAAEAAERLALFGEVLFRHLPDE